MSSHPTPSSSEAIAVELSDRLVWEIRGYGPTLVAFSGGADSALVLAGAVKALGRDAVGAFTAVSAAVPSAELRAAEAFAASLGVAHHTVRTSELDLAEYQANGPDRCFFCRGAVLDAARNLADRHRRRYSTVATGTNADDRVEGFRPGIAAGDQRGVRTPLADVGLSKADVRLLSRRWGLVTWDKPAAPCLASRIAYGVRITQHRLARIERAETAIRLACTRSDLAVRDLRVRDLGQAVRVEVDEKFVPAVRGLSGIAGALTGAGFAGEVAVTVEPFRSGSLNQRERE
ncbi:MAG: ATP-dependent sacrificial sulfur transferase LarE [Micromonosporaceae bacterium]|nr:ATP-dependent sacrificial sulfur transferase LarE [Micromonosporaceae bacterium]